MDDKREELVTALANRGIEAKIEGSSIVMEQSKDEEYDAIRDAIIEADALLRRLAPRRHQLTDIFRDSP